MTSYSRCVFLFLFLSYGGRPMRNVFEMKINKISNLRQSFLQWPFCLIVNFHWFSLWDILVRVRGRHNHWLCKVHYWYSIEFVCWFLFLLQKRLDWNQLCWEVLLICLVLVSRREWRSLFNICWLDFLCEQVLHEWS